MLSFSHFKDMRPAMQSLVSLYWINSLVGSIIGVFVQIYLYQLFGSVRMNVISSIIYFIGLMMGFCVYGYVASVFRFNARHGFALSFASVAAGIFAIAATHTMVQAAGAMLLTGLGGGFFWLTIHTYELAETRNTERDVYSTFLSVGDQIISLAGPAIATVFIVVAHNLHWSELTLLFFVTPCIYLAAAPFMKSLTNYCPQPIRWHDVTHFVTDTRNRAAQFYLFGGAANHILGQIFQPLAFIAILGTALNVGIFNVFFAVISMACLLFVGHFRSEGNRLSILGITTAGIAILDVALGLNLTFFMLVIFEFGLAILGPLGRVSQHVIDLQTMESIGHAKSDFYPTMIFRDVSLWVWRMVCGCILLVALGFGHTNAQGVAIGMCFLAVANLVMFFGAGHLLSAMRRK